MQAFLVQPLTHSHSGGRKQVLERLGEEVADVARSCSILQFVLGLAFFSLLLKQSKARGARVASLKIHFKFHKCLLTSPVL